MLEIKRISQLSKQERRAILNRSSARMAETMERIRPIVEKVAQEGDSAVIEYTERFDGVRLKPEEFFVPQEQIEQAWGETDDELKIALSLCHSNIRNFHRDIKTHLASGWAKTYSTGSEKDRWVCGIMPTAVDRAAGYVPGGTAAYPSTALMVSVPAFAAGVGDFVITTPPREAGTVPQAVLAAAKIAGVTRILRVGGAQAIAALAFGTETIPQVDVVVGPGNVFVTAAKAYLSALGVVGIDFP
ncbi:MAG TPA: histidinol dehydrogenase, partial [bacterium]|nr:histidinol dehydrogenase [bacterium]